MALSTLHFKSDGTEVIQASQLTGKDIRRGKDRRGFRAGDFEKETSSERHLLDNPQVERVRNLVETLGVVGADRLTAQDIAVHEYLIAWARREGIQKPKQKVELGRLLDYLGITKPERVWQSLERLMATLVKYRIVDPSTSKRAIKPLIEQVAMSTNRLTSRTVIDYSIPGVIRDTILQSRSWAWLDINAFPKFATKYTGRIYPKLALMAGYDYRVRKPWTPTIEELAQFIGYSEAGEDIHVGSFLRAIDKVLVDLEEHVDRFKVTCVKPRRGAGRGGRREGTFFFQTTTASKGLYEHQPAVLGPTQINRIEFRQQSPLASREHPETRWFAQAQMMTRIDADELSDRWRMNVADARLHPERRFGALTGALLTSVLNDEGVRQAFRMWINMCVVFGGDVVELPVVSDDTPRVARGTIAKTWIEEEVWYSDDYDEEDEREDLRTGGDFAHLPYREEY
ncbi:hypothetical protein QO002_001130 [Pararhizobium capsulatum DSM 1112]|uniref:Initiator Rep protein domain-containing protein n=1 Tax=Pararhizobium capsulatum DSM 1112 TaxID=1121113 RepID=A0ABU0BLX6_9HYPH|nr:hypothetical protein [Pararhizobium capsulatum]MDQ0318992.1 hypothetical protein [Pararhizobium capsulatum DSM 1112]